MKKSGIYKIINKINNKYYVGSTIDLTKRWKQHKNALNKNIHPNDHLQFAWNKYKNENFDFQIIESVDKLNLLSTEQKYLDLAKQEQNYCYNLTFDAFSPSRFMSEYSRKKLSLSNSGKNNPFYGKKHSIQTKKIISENNTGKHYNISEQTKNKIKQSHLGKKFSEKHKQNISLSKKGIPLSDERKLQISKSCKRGSDHHLFDDTEYSFTNIFSDETIKTTQWDLTKKYNLNPGNVYLMLRDKIHHTDGWTLFPVAAKSFKRTLSTHTKQKISNSLSGLKKSESHKTKMAFNILNNTKIECPHCHKIGQYVNMKRWHFEHCKSIP